MASEGEPEQPSPEEVEQEMQRLLERFGRITRVMEAGGSDIPDSTYDLLHISRPKLHQLYSADEGVAAFAEGTAEWMCDGQFAVLHRWVLAFFTLDDPHSGSYVASPAWVTWRPGRPDYAPDDDEQPWLPRAGRQPRGPDGERHHEYHLFLRRPGEGRYLYAGRAGLAGYTNPIVPLADFILQTKLPREVWERFGGYPGWLVKADGYSERLAVGDTAAFERLLACLGPEEGSIYLTRYEQDHLTVQLNAERGVVWYTGPDDRSQGAARDLAAVGPAEEMVAFLSEYDRIEVPRDETVPRRLAIEAAGEFFRTGHRPQCVGWPEEPAPPSAPAEPPGEPAPRVGFVTEAEWLTGTDPGWLLQSLHHAPAWETGWRASIWNGRPDRSATGSTTASCGCWPRLVAGGSGT